MKNNRAVLFLAAGKQTRFNAAHMKCMSLVGGTPIIQHGAEAWHHRDLYIVVSSMWRPEEVAFVEGLGFTVIHSEGKTIGMSLHDGLVVCEPKLYREIAVVSADTFFVSDDFPIGHFMATFDPVEWVTLWFLRRENRQQRPSSYINMEGRVERMVAARMRVTLVRWGGWVNVNTTEDLERARLLYETYNSRIKP